MARFSRLAIHFLHALHVRHRADVPDVGENFPRVSFQQGSQFAVIAPGAGNRIFIDLALRLAESRRLRRQITHCAIESHVSLALLLGVVKRMRMQERPDKLTADVFEAEFKMSVLVNRMMTAVERGRANLHALLVCDFFGADNARRIARACRGDCGVVRMREMIAQRNARLGRFEGHAIRLRSIHWLGRHLLTGHRSRGILHWRNSAE